MLTRFHNALDKGQIINPIATIKAQTTAHHQMHHEGIEGLLQRNNLDKEQLQRWVRRHVKQKKKEKKERKQVSVAVASIWQPISFITIKPGKFITRTYDNKPVEAEITLPFSMQASSVTQYQWALVMRENPAHFKAGKDKQQINIEGQKILMQPDHPVENVSWNEVQTFIQRVNELIKKQDPLIMKLFDRRIGTEASVRLPTAAEWDFVSRKEGEIKGDYFFGEKVSDLETYAWFNENSAETTHPVMTKHPLLIGRKAIYDLYGNVSEWVADYHNYDALGPFPGKNPQGPETGHYRITKGGSFRDPSNECNSPNLPSADPSMKFNNIGFRLLLNE